MKKASLKSMSLAGCLALLCMGCGSSTTNGTFSPSIYGLDVSSVNPTLGVHVAASPVDNNGAGTVTTNKNGTTYPSTGLQLVYNKGTSVTLTAPPTNPTGDAFFGWTGCDSTSGLTCTVTMNGPKSVQAQYPGVISLVLTPINPTAGVPSTITFTTAVNGIGTCNQTVPPTSTLPPTVPCSQSGFTYTVQQTGVTAPFTTGPNSSGTLLPATSTASVPSIYTTPYPAPTSVVVTVSSLVNPLINATTTVTFDATVAATGPALSVDLGAPLHAISPYIYGMNDGGPAGAATFPPTLAGLVDLPIERWGGSGATRYNYLTDTYNTSGNYFENVELGTGLDLPNTSTINTQLTTDKATNTRALVTVPLVGWSTNRSKACGYSVAKYGPQTSVDSKEPDCGNGTLSSNNKEIDNQPTDTSTAIDQTFDAGWVTYLAGKYGAAANGGVAVYGLDNEPEAWRYQQQDVQSTNGKENYMSYDSVTNSGLTYAAAIKAADPTALVSGPVIANWQNYFTSVVDQFDGYNISPYCQFDNQLDYKAHGSVPLIPYYLQQFAARDAGTGTRTLDYLDLHTEFAPTGVAFSTAGPPLLQQERLDSTRVFWDPTYKDLSGNYPDVITTSSNTPCNSNPPPPIAPMLIPRAKGWVKDNYPGTKVAFSEYNWGGLESINGALAEADILGIFGREGLDMAMLNGAPDPKTQFPGVAAFQMYTNYDGKGSKFGDMALTSTSIVPGATTATGAAVDGESYLAVYGAQRTSDKAITIMVINKGAADQSSTVSLLNTTASGSASSYQFLPAGTAVTAGPAFPITAPASGSTTSTITGTFPAQSITLLIVPQS